MADGAANSTVTRRRQVYPLVHEPRGNIDTRDQSRRDQVAEFSLDQEAPDTDRPRKSLSEGLTFLNSLASEGGDISHLLDPGTVSRIGHDAVREWRIDQASRSKWEEKTRRGLQLASQEKGESDEEVPYNDDEASDINYPILTTAVTQFNARAMPELVKGDKAVGVKVFNPPSQKPNAADVAHAASQSQPPPQPGQPPSPQEQATGQAVKAQSQQETQGDLAAKAKAARAERVAHYMNFLIFYRMDNWEGETDLLLMEMPVSGAGFKKVYMGQHTLESDYVSALRLTVNNSTKSLMRCPRVTQDFDIYPYEIQRGQKAGRYRDVPLDREGEDPEQPKIWIEQHRMEDLDGDGIAEPYIVTCDVTLEETMRIEAAFTPDDVELNSDETAVRRIDRWLPFPSFQFLPDPRGNFYGMGLAALLEAVTDAVDTGLNQLIDAGHAEIAGGGFIGANVRLQGSGQAGALWFRRGEYQMVSTPGPNLQQSIWERTTPHPSAVTMQMLELLLAAAKDIASVKDVISGDAPSTAPVGTTLALQNQALQVFSAIYKRVYRGFRDEFRLMFHCLRRWATPEMRGEYAEMTGGNFEEDFKGDGTDIQPVADPSVVTKMQKIAKMQSMLQLAESPVGQAAGMLTPNAAQALVSDFLDVLDVDRIERFLAQVPPNPELVAKVQLMGAEAQLKQADAVVRQKQATHEDAKSVLDQAKTAKEMGEVGLQTHAIHQEAARVSTQGLQPLHAEPDGDEGKAIQ